LPNVVSAEQLATVGLAWRIVATLALIHGGGGSAWD
jgi:hypothetical protein